MCLGRCLKMCLPARWREPERSARDAPFCSFFSLSFLYLFHSHFVRCWQLELKWLTSEPEAEVRRVWELHGSGLWTVHPLQGRVCLSASMCFSVASAGFFFGGGGIGIGRRSCVLSVKKYQLGLGREWADVRATGLLLYRYGIVQYLFSHCFFHRFGL